MKMNIREFNLKSTRKLLVILLAGVFFSSLLFPPDALSDLTFEQEFYVGEVTVDLAATDLDGAVSEQNEENPGAYVHYNIDNDNGNTNGGPIADKDEDGPVTGENDLKKLTICLEPFVEEGTVVLKRGNTKARVWKNPIKGSTNKILVDSGEKTWNLLDATQRVDFNNVKNNLWIEGYQDNGTCNLTVEYRNPSNDSICSDMVKYTFIGATCGRQPKPAERITAQNTWPNLVHCEWSITGEADITYNCIAWSVGETNVWYNQISNDISDPSRTIIGIDETYGDDDGIFEISDMDAFYNAKGYEPTATSPSDAAVMYYSGFHGARKKGCNCGAGKWIMFESKCGEWVKMEHVWDQLNGTIYGTPIRYYKHK